MRREIIGPCEIRLCDCRDMINDVVFDVVVTDPPYGVDLVARTTKHSTRSASKNYIDTPDHVRSEIVPRVAEYIAKASTSAVATGNRMLQSYPQAAEIGGVFQPNGAGNGPWGFICFHPILFYGKCPFLREGKGSRQTAVSATHWLSDAVDHPCPKPVQFMQWMVERVSFEGDTVCDPFAGSGATAMACIRTNRRFVGCEIDPSYFDIACKRIEDEWLAKLSQLPFEEPIVTTQQRMFD